MMHLRRNIDKQRPSREIYKTFWLSHCTFTYNYMQYIQYTVTTAQLPTNN